MKNFELWGIKVRKDPGRGYYSLWFNLKTYRLDIGDITPLPAEEPEFVDVGITERCNASCPFCYVSAGKGGKDYQDICETWKGWISQFPRPLPLKEEFRNDPVMLDLLKNPPTPEEGEDIGFLRRLLRFHVIKGYPINYVKTPFQVAIGSVGEPTVHPQFKEFLGTVYETNVVPNYTTNGITLSDYTRKECRELLEITSEYCGGVAVSFGNKELRKVAKKAVENLIKDGGCKVMIHHIIGGENSVEDFIQTAKDYGDQVHYHVLLPLMAAGRSQDAMKEEEFLKLAEEVKKEGIQNIALGANFSPWLEKYPESFDVYEYPKEIYSKNILLDSGTVTITPSSFNLTPITRIKV